MFGRHLRAALFSLVTCPALLLAQSSPPAARVIGTVAATGNGTVTVHPASGADTVVTLDAQTRLLQAEPGAKSLADAKPITAASLAVGDRVLVRLSPAGDPTHPVAAVLVAMKQADITQAHAQQAADWRTNGVSGIAASVDPASATITLKARAGSPETVLHTSSSTIFRQYAPDSTAFADAHSSTLAAIHAGDQVRARGARDAGSPSIDAAEVVSGSFADIAGTVIGTDSGANTITLKNLATKKPVTLTLSADTQLRRLPPAMAEHLAHAADRHGAAAAPQEPPAANSQRSEADLLERAPTIPLTELKKGDAVMVVASGPGAPKATAITIVAGVEPLLEAPAEATEGLFSASWNLGGGGAEDAAPQR